MDIKILKEDKNDLEVKIESLTIAELLRNYLNKDPGVRFVAWRREHITKSPILAVRTDGKTAKKAVNDAVSRITKELDKVGADFSKLK